MFIGFDCLIVQVKFEFILFANWNDKQNFDLLKQALHNSPAYPRERKIFETPQFPHVEKGNSYGRQLSKSDN